MLPALPDSLSPLGIHLHLDEVRKLAQRESAGAVLIRILKPTTQLVVVRLGTGWWLALGGASPAWAVALLVLFSSLEEAEHHDTLKHRREGWGEGQGRREVGVSVCDAR